MSDIRKRVGRKGTTYQVRYPSKSSKTGYAYKTFVTLKEARAYVESGQAQKAANEHVSGKLTVEEAIDRWIDICEKEGRDQRDPVSKGTMVHYRWRARAMKAYSWPCTLPELQEKDIIEFRSWLKRTYSRDKAQKVLSSFHSVLIELKGRKLITSDPAEGVTLSTESRYDEPVEIPTIEELQHILQTADDLANSKREDIAAAWARYRPMIYLAADSGMRPQEYLALPPSSLMEKGVNITQALNSSNEIGPPKTRAGRRYIPVGSDALNLAKHYAAKHGSEQFVFATRNAAGHQQYRHFLRSGWHVLMDEAGLVTEEKRGGKKVLIRKYTPYALRHFFASMLIHQNKDAKFIQTVLGHEDISMTFAVYGHLIRRKQAERDEDEGGVLRYISQPAAACGESVAAPR
ncbi:tyrosine-type recombinase/integrase [Sinorhizobium fredii]|uniref:tyrosine-type recombinase/integrase n=1 Tax=Rhizobium fredii TaxID=380 RepID=UPI00059560D9|nr:site-specific integrase [Sinorhizobium fredii]WOS62050.1 site-specific integrase [Sinorhizobium fredii GR64]